MIEWINSKEIPPPKDSDEILGYWPGWNSPTADSVYWDGGWRYSCNGEIAHNNDPLFWAEINLPEGA